MKKILPILLLLSLVLSLTACGASKPVSGEPKKALIYGSGDCTRINPAMDEQREINVLLFDGQPFTAEDVKFTIEAIQNPDNGAENWCSLFYLNNLLFAYNPP